MRQSLVSSGKIHTAETRQKLSSKALQRFQDPRQRVQVTEQNRRTAQLSSHPFRNQTPEQRAVILHAAAKGRGRASRGASFLERKMKWFLERQGIVFEPQWPFFYGDEHKRAHADFFLPGPNVVVECDGYFHNRPEVKEKDKQRDAHLAALGIKTMRFNDDAIRNRFIEVASKIREHCCIMLMRAKRITVNETNQSPCYDLRVEEDESFIAGGIVVHNCPICEPLDGEHRKLDEAFSFGGMNPPVHPSCRCAVGLVTPR
jgi:very-short-patch-repair endonuclease